MSVIEERFVKVGYDKGMEEGIAIVAMKLFKEGQDINFVEKVTGISKDKLIKLKNSL